MNSDPQAAKRELALSIFDVGAVLTPDSDHSLVVTRGNERGFKMKLHDKDPDAPLSPIYMMLRTASNPKPGPLTSKIVKLAAHCMAQALSYHEVDFDVVAGIPNAGDPFARAFADITGCELVELKKDVSDGGRKIVSSGGSTKHKKKGLLMDDLMTAADTKLEAAQAMAAMGYKVTDLAILIDREQGGRKKLLEQGISVYHVFTLAELLDILVEEQRITSERRDEIKAYLAANS